MTSTTAMIDPGLAFHQTRPIKLDHLRMLSQRLSGSIPRPGIPDPFDALPTATNPRLAMLMDHYDHIFVQTMIPVNPKRTWLKYALADPVLFQATLLISAVHLALLHGGLLGQEVLYHKGETIRLVNDRLGDPKQGATDGTIGAVACLAIVENLGGITEASQVHTDGLEYLVQSRGGLEALATNEHVRNLVSWVDLCSSSLLQSKPRFRPLLMPNEGEPTDFGPLSDLTLLCGLTLGTTLYTFTGLRKLSEDTAKIFCGLRCLSALLDSLCPTDVKKMDNIKFSDKLYLLERRVVSLIEIGDLSNESDHFKYIFLSFGQAALIYIYSDLRGLPKSAKLFGKLGERVKDSLQLADLDLVSQRLPAMLRWILLVGAEAAVEAPHTLWYNSQLLTLGITPERGDKESLKRLTESFLWPEKAQENQVSQVEVFEE